MLVGLQALKILLIDIAPGHRPTRTSLYTATKLPVFAAYRAARAIDKHPVDLTGDIENGLT